MYNARCTSRPADVRVTMNPPLLIVLNLLLLVSCTFARGEQPPNFVVIFTDDQGYQDVGCFGSPNIKTPHLDRMAEQGVKFTDFYSMAPVCSASRAGLLTGCYPARVGTTGVYFPRHDRGLNPNEETIAEVLKPRGYTSACIGKWHLGHHEEFLPTSQGFDYYFGLPYSNDMDPVKTIPGKRDLDQAFAQNDIRRWNVPLMRNAEIIERPAKQWTLTKRYTEEAVRFIERSKDQPFFLYLPHTMPHIPIFVSDGFHTDDPTAAYQRCIEEIDWSVGQVLDALKSNGVDERTLVIFTTDNGPWLNLKQAHHGGSALPLRAGKFSTWEGGMRVPMIARWPGKIPAGTTCSQVAATFDLLPTFASLATAQLPKNKIDGHDIWPLLCSESDKSPHEAFFYYKGNALKAVRSGRWKLHLKATKGRGKQAKELRRQLFDLVADIGETTNVIESHAEVATALAAIANEFAAELKAGARAEGKLPAK